MATVKEVLDALQEKNQGNEFRLATDGKGFMSYDNGRYYSVSDLRIIKTYRFEGDSNPSDSSIIYVLQAKDGHLGYILDAFGMYSDYEGDSFDRLIRALRVAGRRNFSSWSGSRSA